jgi:hypothetical protein
MLCTITLPRAVSEITLMAWTEVAEPGAQLIYHMGFLAVDTTANISKLPRPEMDRLRATADAAYRLAECGLVHLVQQRLGTDRFAYIAIARPKPKPPRSTSIAQLLQAA